jgi:hypothetical protein
MDELKKKYKHKYVKKQILIDGKAKEVVCLPEVTSLKYTDTIYQYAIISTKKEPGIALTKEEFKDQSYVFDVIVKDNMVAITNQDYSLIPCYSSIDITKNVKLNLDEEKDKSALLDFLSKYYKHDVKNILDLSTTKYTTTTFQEETRFLFNSKEFKVKDIYETNNYIFARHHEDVLIFNKKFDLS